VTESDWLQATDPTPMLRCLGEGVHNRKLRLFVVACCRRIWGLLTDEQCFHMIEVAERYADGMATEEERRAAATAYSASAASRSGSFPAYAAVWARLDGSYPASPAAVQGAASAVRTAFTYGIVPFDPTQVAHVARSECAAQAALLRDIFGPLAFRPLPAVDPEWLAWNGGLVPALAEAAYEERNLPAGTLDPARLAVLADALEEAGCTEAELLAHLRSPDPHVRGCWALDVVLGKE
jgi:hypothetical protein